MADVTQTLALIVLAQNYAGDIVRNINRRSVLLQILPSVAGDGKNVGWVAASSGAVAEFVADGADASDFGSDAQAGAILPWVWARSNIHVSTGAMASARASRTPLGNIDLWARNMLDSATALSDKINKGLYSGAGGLALTGLGQAIGLDNNTYATIDRTVLANAFWKPYVVDPGVLTAITRDQIRSDMAAIYVACGERPDFAMVSPAVYKAVASIFDPNKFYMMETMVSDFKAQFEGGSQMLKFDGMTLIEDKDATESTIFYLNSRHCRIEYIPLNDLAMGAGDESMQMGLTDGVVQLPLGLTVQMLGKAGLSDRAQMVAQLQLVVDRPNAFGVRKNVAI